MGPDRLSPLDASFLHIEDHVSHMHIASVTIFEGPPPPFADIVDMVDAKLDLVPRSHTLGAARLQALVVVVHRDRQDALRALLADHVLVENFLDFLGLWKLVPGPFGTLLELLADDVVAELDAFVANENRRPGD